MKLWPKWAKSFSIRPVNEKICLPPAPDLGQPFDVNSNEIVSYFDSFFCVAFNCLFVMKNSLRDNMMEVL